MDHFHLIRALGVCVMVFGVANVRRVSGATLLTTPQCQQGPNWPAELHSVNSFVMRAVNLTGRVAFSDQSLTLSFTLDPKRLPRDITEAAELEAKLQDFTVIALIKRKFQHGRYLDCLPLGVPGGVTAKHLMKRRRYKAPEVVTKFGEAMSPKVLVDFIAGYKISCRFASLRETLDNCIRPGQEYVRAGRPAREAPVVPTTDAPVTPATEPVNTTSGEVDSPTEASSTAAPSRSASTTVSTMSTSAPTSANPLKNDEEPRKRERISDYDCRLACHIPRISFDTLQAPVIIKKRVNYPKTTHGPIVYKFVIKGLRGQCIYAGNAEDAACKRFQPNPNPSQNEMLFKPPSMCRASNAEDQDRNVILTITCKPPATMTLNHLCQRRACVKLLNQYGKVEVCQRMVPKKKCRRQQ